MLGIMHEELTEIQLRQKSKERLLARWDNGVSKNVDLTVMIRCSCRLSAKTMNIFW